MSWLLLTALTALAAADEAATPPPPSPGAEAGAGGEAGAPPPGGEGEEEAVALREPTPQERAAEEHAQELVSGAPLYNPNVSVHIVQRKAFADVGKREAVLFPAVPQANGKFTQ